jgi:hypothetical protein
MLKLQQNGIGALESTESKFLKSALQFLMDDAVPL